MPKTTFVRKPVNMCYLRIGAEWIEARHNGEAIDSYYVAEDVQLEENEFMDLQENMLADRKWVAVAAIRVSCKGSLIVLIIDPQGHDYPRYVGLEYED